MYYNNADPVECFRFLQQRLNSQQSACVCMIFLFLLPRGFHKTACLFTADAVDETRVPLRALLGRSRLVLIYIMCVCVILYVYTRLCKVNTERRQVVFVCRVNTIQFVFTGNRRNGRKKYTDKKFVCDVLAFHHPPSLLHPISPV